VDRAEREQRWTKCLEYIKRASSLPEAQDLAKRDGFAAPTAAWITAWGKWKATDAREGEQE
jgi:hypothetical protein